MIGKEKKQMEKSTALYTKKICEICKDQKGKLSKEYCRDNEKSPHYDGDLFGSTDYIDCWGYIRQNETEEEHKIRVNQKWNDKDKVEFEYV